MKLAINTDLVTKSNVEVSGGFKIKASAKAFKILSSGLYSDKILAVVRELSCNAYDSHVSAGFPNKPIDVHMPNSGEPWFSVQDYGLGLSKDDIDQVYTTYFESTKTDSNEVTGALGLGSKSPFSYTDTFTVVSIKDGIKLIYTMCLSPAGEPLPRLMFEGETDEANGVTVSLPVNKYDFNDFVKAATKVYRTFDVKPIVIGAFENDIKAIVKPQEYLFKNAMYGLRTQEPVGLYNVLTIAVQGTVGYPCKIEDGFGIARALHKMDIFFPIGELDITASRESLSYDVQTKENIAARVRLVADNLKTDYQGFIDTQPTFYEGLLAAQKASDYFDRYHSIFSYKGVMIESPHNVEMPTKALDGFDVEYATIKSGRRTTRVSTTKLDHHRRGSIPISDCMYFANDLGIKGMPVIKKYILDNNIKNSIIVAIEKDYKLTSSEYLQCFSWYAKQIDGLMLISASTLPPVPKKVTAAKTRQYRFLLRATDGYYSYQTIKNRIRSEVATVTLPGTSPIVYTRLDDYNQSGVKWLFTNNITDRLYIVNKVEEKRALKDPRWIHIGDFIKSKFTPALISLGIAVKVYDQLVADISKISSGNLTWRKLINSKIMQNLSITVPAHRCRPTVVHADEELLNLAWTYDRSTWERINESPNEVVDLSAYTEFVANVKKLPLLAQLDVDGLLCTDGEDALLEYIKFIEEKV